MEIFKEFVKVELLVLIPVLYFVGVGIKTSKVKDKFIPLILGLVGVVLSTLWVMGTSYIAGWQNVLIALFTAITQGVLVAGCSVYVNQIVKQSQKDE